MIHLEHMNIQRMVISVIALFIFMTMNAWGVGVVTQSPPVLLAETHVHTSGIDFETRAISAEWLALIESLFSTKTASAAFDKAESDVIATEALKLAGPIWQVSADITDVRQFLLDNCLEYCAGLESLAENRPDSDRLWVTRLMGQVQR